MNAEMQKVAKDAEDLNEISRGTIGGAIEVHRLVNNFPLSSSPTSAPFAPLRSKKPCK
jgi:hypothetical protein